jgi:ADP-ribose diphosphatase
MHNKPKILKTVVVAESRLFRIERLDLEFSNGVRTQYERLRSQGPGAVLIVPMTDADTVLLISEYAAGTERYELGFPKGRIESGEDMLESANRELMEEVGQGARSLEHMTSFTLAPGYLGHVTHIILARDLYPQSLPGDEPEPIEVHPWPLADIHTLIAEGRLTEARSIAAAYMAREHLGSG